VAATVIRLRRREDDQSGRIVLPASLEQVFPYRGPCGFCGDPDARHRVLDAIWERASTGESFQAIADDYYVRVSTVADVVTYYHPAPEVTES
jgi:hypothetical protein